MKTQLPETLEYSKDSAKKEVYNYECVHQNHQRDVKQTNYASQTLRIIKPS
jgi:hypothetical protein